MSTIPLPHLLGCLSECPEQVVRRGSELETVSLKILMMLVRLHDPAVPQRVYIADPAVPPHKVAFNHASAPTLASRRHHAVVCEASYSPMKPAPPDELLVEATREWLAAGRFIRSDRDVVASSVIDVPFGYPVETHVTPQVVAEIKDHLEPLGIHSIGRFGGWRYVNSDECVREGMASVARLRDGHTCEPHPDRKE